MRSKRNAKKTAKNDEPQPQVASSSGPRRAPPATKEGPVPPPPPPPPPSQPPPSMQPYYGYQRGPPPPSAPRPQFPYRPGAPPPPHFSAPRRGGPIDHPPYNYPPGSKAPITGSGTFEQQPGGAYPSRLRSSGSNSGASQPYTNGYPQQNNDARRIPRGNSVGAPAPGYYRKGPYTAAQQEKNKASGGYGQGLPVGRPRAYRRNAEDDRRSLKKPVNRPGASSPTEIDSTRRDDVTSMGCTCKKTKCLKLYCVCFGASITCGPNCRCLVCNNTPLHEQVRKEAIRGILARNPHAFDTKFRKTEGTVTKTGPDRVVTHKTGCKCRKSFCMKKYCECYNAQVRCSGNCRCIGCKNVGGGNLPTSKKPAPPPRAPVRSFATDVATVKATRLNPPPRKPQPVLNAAQNLAFLKHASSSSKQGRPIRQIGPEARDNSSLPSLTSSENSASPEADADKARVAVTKKSVDSPAGVDDSLLMAAYAMTELHQEGGSRVGDKEQSDVPPAENGSTIQQKVSPKRKSLEKGVMPTGTVDNGSKESKPTSLAGSAVSDPEKPLLTPRDRSRIKRTRFGTVDRKCSGAQTDETSSDKVIDPTKPKSEGGGDNDDEEENDQDGDGATKDKPEKVDTPQSKKDAKKSSVLTPVSARLFKHMGVSEKGTDGEEDEKKVESEPMDVATNE